MPNVVRTRVAAGILAVVLLLGGCVEEPVAPPRSYQDFVFWPESISVAEGSRSVTGWVKRLSRGDSVGVMVRTVSESPDADTRFHPMTAVLLFGRNDTLGQFQVPLTDNHDADGDRHFSVRMDPHFGFDALTRPSVLGIRVLDDEVTGPPRSIDWPLSIGTQWDYSVTGSTTSPEGGTREWTSSRTDRVTRVVRFKGQDFHMLEGGEVQTDLRILLRQEGSLIYYALANDTTDGAPGSLQHRLRGTLPWVLVDFGEGPGQVHEHFAYDTTENGSFRIRLAHSSRFLRRTTLIVHSRVYRDVAVVGFARSRSESGRLPSEGTESRELYICDSVGVVRQTYSFDTQYYPAKTHLSGDWEALLLPN